MTRRLDAGERVLPPGLLRYLATGDYSGAPLDVFLFAGLLLRFPDGRSPAGERYQEAAGALEALWREHEAEIRAAAGQSEPWCQLWLREHSMQSDQQHTKEERTDERRPRAPRNSQCGNSPDRPME
jgi:hypothetical protein